MKSKKEVVYRNEGEFSTDIIFRIDGKYYRGCENGGSRGSHSVSNKFPKWLEEPEEIESGVALALMD